MINQRTIVHFITVNVIKRAAYRNKTKWYSRKVYGIRINKMHANSQQFQQIKKQKAN